MFIWRSEVLLLVINPHVVLRARFPERPSLFEVSLEPV